MTRRFDPTPLPDGLLEALLDTARRAPSAGFSQGSHLLVLQGDGVQHFWSVTGAGEHVADGVTDAPVLVLALADPAAYTSRYSAHDKAGHGLEETAGWPVPYWLTDTAMVVQNLLLLCEDRGIGALWFGVFRNGDRLLASLGVPERVQLVGVVAVGRRHVADQPSGSAVTRPRRGRSEQIHDGRW